MVWGALQVPPVGNARNQPHCHSFSWSEQRKFFQQKIIWGQLLMLLRIS